MRYHCNNISRLKRLLVLATIRAALGTQFRITGLDSPQESSELALLLRAGALAAPMRFVEERTVGPSLGEENIRAGILSMELGMALVLLFTLFYYRIFGLAASLALSSNVVLIVAVMSIFVSIINLTWNSRNCSNCGNGYRCKCFNFFQNQGGIEIGYRTIASNRRRLR